MRFLNGVTLCLTTRCNLTCSYCSQKDYYRQVCKQDDMSLQTAFLATVLVEKGGKIGFFGGEPMLSFDLMKEIVRNNSDKRFSIVSNGTAVFENYDWLRRNVKCSFKISYDGRNSDRGQKSDGPALVTIKKLVKNGAKPRVRTTLTPTSLETFPETIKELTNIGVRKVWFEIEDGLDLQNKDLVSALFLKIKEAKTLCNSLILETSALFPGPCEVCKGKDAYILPDGQIYLCHKNLSAETLIGNVSVNSSVDIIENLMAKRKVEPSQTLCLVQEKRIGWKFVSQVLRKILKGGDDKMHMRNEALFLVGKIAQISDALEALGNRLKKTEEELLAVVKEEIGENSTESPNGPNR